MVRIRAKKNTRKETLPSRVGFAEMPDLHLIVTPVFGESQYSYALVHEFLEARIRDEIKVGHLHRLFSSKAPINPLLAFIGPSCYG